MRGRICITVEVDREQGQSYQAWLVRQYELAMSEFWFDDRYRNTPQGLRAARILADHPYVAGISRTLRELRKQLQEARG